MNRLGIFSFFDRDGMVGEYIDFLLNDLVSNLELLVVVVNGTLSKEGYKVFQRYTDRILLRENVGFDAGAYKDAIMDYIGIEKIREYDQLVLCNDTFYGPFVPFKEIYAEMDKLDIDFWGINYIDNKIFNHIQSYFLVFNKQIIESGDLFEYFVGWIDANSIIIENLYACFEVGLFYFLQGKGYHFDAYMNKNHCDIYKSSNFSLKKYKCPLMKRKCFSSQYFRKENVMDALNYITDHFDYDIMLILQDANRVYGFPYSKEEIINHQLLSSDEEQIKIAKVGREEIETFLKANQQIYIYGTGNIARKIIRFYSPFFRNIKGFIVSDDQNIHDKEIFGFKIQKYAEIELADSSVLVALNAANTKLVIKNLVQCKNVLLLWGEDFA